ncbi:MAG: NLP/P60 protein [Candidatus Kaiserbacteria bacterium GW2011_GWC2_52_8b]|uniref:NLP/P60 protein n=2 Tax=Candidatus Kaiseribacteriota TaxID=1752734 RepID=A0A0G1ZTV6_9BACT|nr:MAG: NLP/P60 protein [Candidatus Kaiserbacteria bacterium GW2011_GWA2_52_12]KKW31732.1 MAG: NLP/P60 protein [Candidatus Kaiserbacteria bacterium GW2011_GWC2_52_8b]
MNKTISLAAFFATLMVVPFLASAATVISIQLDPGMTNSDVSALQTFLAKDSSIYPEGLVTGFFGPLTEAAVIRYQTAHGISPVGRVGPVTLASINGLGGTGGSDDVNAPITSGVMASANLTSAMITWSNNEPVFGRVMYATSWPFLYSNAPSVTSSSGFSSAQAVTLGGLQSHTTYHYVVESTDVAGNLTWTIGNTFTTAQ